MVDSYLSYIPVKLFKNLSTDLAEVVKSLFLFIALVAILFKVAEPFEKFWYRVTQETFLYTYFKIHLLVQEEKSFKGFSSFSSAGHLIQQSGTGNFGGGSPKKPSVKLFQSLSSRFGGEVV